MDNRINNIRYIIGTIFLLIGIYLFVYFGDYYLTFIEQTKSSGVMWHFYFFPEDSIPQIVLSTILIISSMLFLLKKKNCYYLFTLFFVGVILDSTYTAFVSARMFEGILLRFYIPVLFSIICLILLNLKLVKKMFDFEHKIKLTYLIIILLIATINTLNTRTINTGYVIEKQAYNKS